MPQPTPFALRIDQSAIDDLNARLARTRLPDEPPAEATPAEGGQGTPWNTGTDRAALAGLIEHWRADFDWRAQEAALNALPQFRVPLDGIDLHYLHVPGRGRPGGREPLPLLLLHGWPGSVFEFLELIPRLADPARFGGDPDDACTVVAPSLPGFGLSFRPGQRRFGVVAMAEVLDRLMREVLGYRRYGAQGGDWGSFIATRLGHAYSEALAGIHLNLLPLRREPAAAATPEVERYNAELAAFLKEETGYQWIQGTRPQTLAYALTDSPAGLAAWILEKFQRWTDCGGDPFRAVDRDRMLANIGLYWFTGAIGSTFWPYYDRMHGRWPVPEGGTVEVPMGYAAFPKEILRPPRVLAERVYRDIRRWTPMPRGGHFAALEQPDALAAEVLAFFRPLRDEG